MNGDAEDADVYRNAVNCPWGNHVFIEAPLTSSPRRSDTESTVTPHEVAGLSRAEQITLFGAEMSCERETRRATTLGKLLRYNTRLLELLPSPLCSEVHKAFREYNRYVVLH